MSCYFLTTMFMFHCSPDFGHRTTHGSGIPPEAAGEVTVCQCKIPLIALSDFHSSFSYSCIVLNLGKACFGVNSLHITPTGGSDFGCYDPNFPNSINMHQASFC